jgi:hypothetical protein
MPVPVDDAGIAHLLEQDSREPDVDARDVEHLA